MHESENTKIVQAMYGAFSRGDLQAIVDQIADDVVWHAVYGTGAQVPMGGERHGKAAVATFFKELGDNVQFTHFEPKEFIATGDKVVTLGHYAATSPIKKSFDADFAMVFTLRHGKVVRFQEFTDSAAIDRAYDADRR